MKEVVTFLVVLILALGISAHRLCLDFSPPTYKDETFTLCRDYENFGCCSQIQDGQLYQKYQSVIENMEEELKSRCSSVIKDLLCQVCSEYSAHLFNLEETGTIANLPRLCPNYCSEIFRNCSEALQALIDDENQLNYLREGDEESFCDSVKSESRYYCYPMKDENEKGYLRYFRLPKQKPCQNLCVQEVANRLYSPLSIKNAGDGSRRLFVVEQRGIVWAFLPSMEKIHPPFLNKTLDVACKMNGYDERGFLDIQFHPNYTVNGLFYIYYTVQHGSKSDPVTIRISEMKISADDMNKADPTSERIILEVTKRNTYSNHNGGQLLFGPDSYLYVFIGDSGGQGDQENNAQNMSSLFGKILRIKPEISSGGEPYSIPDDNPFVSVPTVRPEIYAYGLRNPWRCSFNQEGTLYCGDVGQHTYEEIDIIKKGGNYGWRAFEAESCFDDDMCRNASIADDHIPPIYFYDHSFGMSITGGLEYRGCQYSALEGSYIYGDFMSGRIAMIRKNKRGKWIKKNVCMPKKICGRFGKQYEYPRYILTFGEDESGEIYFGATTDPKPGSRGGRIYKITDSFPTSCLSKCYSAIETPTVLSSDATLQQFVPMPGGKIEIRLVGSDQNRIPTKGRIEIRPEGGPWSTICGDAFSIEAAHVVCRMLGFINAREFSVGEFGRGEGKIRFDRLICSGEEDHIDECEHEGWRPTRACKHKNDASVWCESFTFGNLP